MLPYKLIRDGFEYGPATIRRVAEHPEKGWIVLKLETAKYVNINRLQIYVTKTGKVRIMNRHGEWFLHKRNNEP